MGLLDDAIREHLELKRRRGADAGDISRQESEALGPVSAGPTVRPIWPRRSRRPTRRSPRSRPLPRVGRADAGLSPPAPPGYEPPATIEPEAPPAPAA